MKVKYYGIEEAVCILKRRSRTFSRFNFKSPIPEGSCILFRHLLSCRLEDIDFIRRCRPFSIRPIFITYSKDRWVPEDISKKRLVEIRIFLGFGINNGVKSRYYKIIPNFYFDTKSEYRLKMSDLKTNWGESLMGWHRSVTKKILGDVKEIDVSDWLQSIGPAEKYYYFLLKGAALGKYILFESFNSHGFPQLDAFKAKVLEPNLRRLAEEDLPPPLIVYHPSLNIPEEIYLNYYPSEIEYFIPR